VALLFFLAGCEKKIDFRLNDAEPKLVVDGAIENGNPPVVTLTKTLGYFNTLSPQELMQSFVHGADVFVSNGSLTHKLKEYTVNIAPGINFYYYSVDSSDLATAFVGELNHAYSLRIVTEGKEYTATTTIPDTTKRIDSLWWKPAPFTSDTTKVVVMVKAYDPPGYGDYMRYYTKNQRQPAFYPPSNSVYDDLFIDGTSYEVQLQPGWDRNADTTDKDFFFRGDTVDFKVANIDRATFDFWRTWEYAITMIGNPFSTPSKILGNISNGALGHFGGYGVQYRTLVIPR